VDGLTTTPMPQTRDELDAAAGGRGLSTGPPTSRPIEDALVAGTGVPPVAVHGKEAHATWRRALPWALAGISTLVLLALAIANALRPRRPATRPVVRFVVTLPPGDRLAPGLRGDIALAPDASRLMYVANRSGRTQLYVRAIDRFEATPIQGTEGAENPF